MLMVSAGGSGIVVATGTAGGVVTWRVTGGRSVAEANGVSSRLAVAESGASGGGGAMRLSSAAAQFRFVGCCVTCNSCVSGAGKTQEC